MVAGRGAGCWLDDRRCHVSAHASLDGALVNTSSYETFSDAALVTMKSEGAMMRTWGDAYGYFLVAAGQAEAMIDPICSTWDLAPMPVIIAEAGGRFTDLDARTDYRSGNGVATNGQIHEAVLAAMGAGPT